MKVVVTGVNGFVGKHLARTLCAENHDVYGIGQETQAHVEIRDELTGYYNTDLTEHWPVDDVMVDAIIHLAGLAAVGPSFDDPQKYINLNSAMVTHIGEHYRTTAKKPRVVVISSGAVYDPTVSMPITESSPVTYTSPYAVSKILVENQAAYYRSLGQDWVVMRPFNHIGPGQLPGFLVPDLAYKLRQRADDSEPLRAGNLTTKRDYTDVRDVVRAYALVATKPSPLNHSLYNVCSNHSRSGEEVLASIVAGLGIPEPTIEIDQSLIRPNDIADIRSDNSRLYDEFGWQPEIDFDQTITDFLAA